MARAGRELETLVAVLEQALRPQGVHIQSPDYVEDTITGRRREVDVGIRAREGGTLLAFCECRDRSKAQDVTWVEQVVTKARDAKGSPPVILVSRHGFSPEAIKKAEAYRHDVRTMTDATAEEFRDWLQVEHVQVIATSAVLHGCEIRLVEDGPDLSAETASAIEERGINAAIFERATLPRLSAEHFFNEWYAQKAEVIAHEIPADGTAVRLRAPTSFQDPESCVRVRTTAGPLPVAQIDLLVEVTRSPRLVPPTRASRYADPIPPVELAQNVEFALGEDLGTVSVHHLADGQKVVFYRPHQK
jgi:Restriction endonuclease